MLKGVDIERTGSFLRAHVKNTVFPDEDKVISITAVLRHAVLPSESGGASIVNDLAQSCSVSAGQTCYSKGAGNTREEQSHSNL